MRKWYIANLISSIAAFILSCVFFYELINSIYVNTVEVGYIFDPDMPIFVTSIVLLILSYIGNLFIGFVLLFSRDDSNSQALAILTFICNLLLIYPISMCLAFCGIFVEK